MNKGAYEAAVKAAQRARCARCGKKVTLEDRCQDGLYLHLDCARATMSQPDMRRERGL